MPIFIKIHWPMLEGHPSIIGFHLYDKNGKKNFFAVRCGENGRWLWEITREKYDLILNLTEGVEGPLLHADSGAEIPRWVWILEGGFWGKQRIYTHIVKPLSNASPYCRAESGMLCGSHRYCVTETIEILYSRS